MRNCVRRGGEWTSGVHLVWWTRKRLRERPEVKVSDLRHPISTSLARQEDLTAWSVVMLRLHLLADVAVAAPKLDPLSSLVSVAEEAAEATDTPDLNALLEWISRNLDPRLKTSLPDSWYEGWRAALHSESEDEHEDPPSTGD